MSLNELFRKGHNESRSRIFTIKTVWEDGYFQLFVIESTNSWYALVAEEQIKELAEQHELDVEIYLKSLKEYFSNEHDSSITFDITKKQFVMYRKIETENFRVKYFLTNLEKLVFQETIGTIIDELITKQKELLKKLEIAEEQKLESERQKLLYQQKCEEFIEMKQKADHKMYSAFTLILNEKKERIQFLTELLEEYNKNEGKQKFPLSPSPSSKSSLNGTKRSSTKLKREINQVDSSSSIPSTSKVCKKTLENVSDSEPSDGYDTDEEKKQKVFLNENTVPCPTSTDDLDFLGDSSPPRALPKRAKRNKNVDTIGSLLDSPQKANQKTKTSNETKVEPMDAQENNSDDSQPLAFSTQELWERM